MTEKKQKTPALNSLFRQIWRTFVAGLVVVLPGALIVIGIIWLFDLADGILRPLVNILFGRPIPGLGILLTLLLILIVGIVTSNVVGNSIVRFGEFLIARLPVLAQVYSGAKQAMQALSVPGAFKGGFRKVIILEYPRAGVFTLGFITNKIKDREGSPFVTVFLPTSPFPHTGTWILATRDQIIETDVSFLKAIQMTITWGILSPKRVLFRRSLDSRSPDER
ncbi:DUF502 domain-containing protein [Dehalogenimonas etheniformans]|uniref:DUF502 domain-containing protein n=1 Tax=Dehalogenimonas etheniformans TaxID=1536648 RepID=UPI000CC8D04E|nr:DUF502 domain-containing protein [Dehalogenimonas etheniformans]QNT76011.1 DUF502 domain-containing protein [Dehalogenimonas etheniformans]